MALNIGVQCTALGWKDHGRRVERCFGWSQFTRPFDDGRVRWSIVLAAASVGCGEGNDDLTGPFVGEIHRYAVDGIVLPTTHSMRAEFGDDLSGDGTIDNQLGVVLSLLAVEGDTTTHAADMIAAGAIASSVEIQTDDLEAGQLVGVVYRGVDGDDATAAAGRFDAGSLSTNRTRTTHHPGSAHARLPVFADADPIAVTLEGLEIDLVPDGTGYTATIRGGIPLAEINPELTRGLNAMILANPSAHLWLARLVDADHDGKITMDEVANNALLQNYVAPDVEILGAPVLSVGFQVHLVPCPDGDCGAIGHADACFDRVLDGNETDTDCGDSCLPCAAGAACRIDNDCQTGACDLGRCRSPTCSDGLRDGLESDVDCGANCPACAVGRVCAASTDCASTRCSADAIHGISLGTCSP